MNKNFRYVFVIIASILLPMTLGIADTLHTIKPGGYQLRDLLDHKNAVFKWSFLLRSSLELQNLYSSREILAQ